jgi:hypothetical protein
MKIKDEELFAPTIHRNIYGCKLIGYKTNGYEGI